MKEYFSIFDDGTIKVVRPNQEIFVKASKMA